MPITGILYSLEKYSAPVNVPSPPIATRASIPADFIFSYAFALPSFVLNSRHLAVLRIVPPN
ncbi:hypothetical protein D3C87_1776090 [compost metagenome]